MDIYVCIGMKLYVAISINLNTKVCVCGRARNISTRMAHDEHRHPHNPRHMLDTARACERMRVYVYLVDRLYRRAVLNKHAHRIQVPVHARPLQRCLTFPLRALAGDYSTEVNSIR